jgi:hypothetical protein
MLRHGRVLEGIALSWNPAGIAALVPAAASARSSALAGFGLGPPIGTGDVAVRQLAVTGNVRQPARPGETP